ncbi:MAG TPA: hypothetical protein VMH34_01380 [Gammaproteobacteria bacterium]|nr:hypothetical protein [Gammaproteobacteria bacterium]
MRVLPAVLLLWLPLVAATAKEVRFSTIYEHDGEYTVEIDAALNASPAELRRLLTDYNHLTRLNDVLTESTLLVTHDAHHHKTRMTAQRCIAMICFKAVLVEEATELVNGDLENVIVPAESDFRAGVTRWHFEPLPGNQTRVYFESIKTPAFFIPPIIGTSIMKKLMMDESLAAMDHLEALSGHGP